MAFDLSFNWEQNHLGDFAKAKQLIDELRAAGKGTAIDLQALEAILLNAARRGQDLEATLKRIKASSVSTGGTAIPASNVLGDTIQSLKAHSSGVINLTGQYANLRSAAGLAGQSMTSMYGSVGLLNSVFGGLSTTTVLAGAAFVGVAGAIIKAGISTAEYGREVSNLSSQLGVSTRDAQLLIGASEVTGVKVESLAQGFRALSKAIGEGTEEGKKQQALLARFQIDPYNEFGKLKDNMTILMEVLEVVSKLGPGFQQQFAISEFLGRGGINTLKEAVDLRTELARQSQRDILSSENIDTAKKANDILQRMLGTMKDLIHWGSMPILKGFVGLFGGQPDHRGDSYSLTGRRGALPRTGPSFMTPDMEEMIKGREGKEAYQKFQNTDLFERLTTHQAQLEKFPPAPQDDAAALAVWGKQRDALKLQIKADREAITAFENSGKKAQEVAQYFSHLGESLSNLAEGPLQRVANRMKEIKEDPNYRAGTTAQKAGVEADYIMAMHREEVKLAQEAEKKKIAVIDEQARLDMDFDKVRMESQANINKWLAPQVKSLTELGVLGNFDYGVGEKPDAFKLRKVLATYPSAQDDIRGIAREERSALATVGRGKLSPIDEIQETIKIQSDAASKEFAAKVRLHQYEENAQQKIFDDRKDLEEKINTIREDGYSRLHQLSMEQHQQEVSLFTSLVDQAIEGIGSKDPGKAIRNILKGFGISTLNKVIENELKDIIIPMPNLGKAFTGTMFGPNPDKAHLVEPVAIDAAYADSMKKFAASLDKGVHIDVVVHVIGGGGRPVRPAVSVTTGPNLTVSAPGSGGGGGGISVVTSGISSSTPRFGESTGSIGDLSSIMSPFSPTGGAFQMPSFSSSFGSLNSEDGGVPSSSSPLGSGGPLSSHPYLRYLTDAVSEGGGLASAGHSVTGAPFDAPPTLPIGSTGTIPSLAKAMLPTPTNAQLFSSATGIMKGLSKISNFPIGKSTLGGILPDVGVIGGGVFAAAGGLGGHGAGGDISAVGGATSAIGGVLKLITDIGGAIPGIGPLVGPLMEGIGMITSLIGGLLGTTREQRAKNESKELQNNVFLQRVPISVTQGLGGGYADFDATGMARGSALSPYPQVNEPAYTRPSGGNNSNFVLAPGATMSQFGAGGGTNINLNLSAIDGASAQQFLMNNQDSISESIRQLLVTGNGTSLVNAINGN